MVTIWITNWNFTVLLWKDGRGQRNSKVHKPLASIVMIIPCLKSCFFRIIYLHLFNLPYGRNRKLYPISIYNDQQDVLSPPLRSFFLEREGQQLCPLCHAFMHIFAPYISLGGRWHELIWCLRKLRFHGNYHGCPHTIFLLLLVGWCSNRCLDSMYVSLVTSYETTKPPARVCCEIFINGRWK